MPYRPRSSQASWCPSRILRTTTMDCAAAHRIIGLPTRVSLHRWPNREVRRHRVPRDCAQTERIEFERHCQLHVLRHGFGLLVIDDIGNGEDDGLVAFVLPPVLESVRFARDLSGLMQNRHRALAAVFIDLALVD